LQAKTGWRLDSVSGAFSTPRPGFQWISAGFSGRCLASLIVTIGAVERILFQSGDDVLRMLVVVYGPYVQNALAKTSTWLVVVTAVGRYVAICRPLEARKIAAGPRNTGLAVAGAFVGSAMIELPTAWEYSITRFDCPDTYYYLLDQYYTCCVALCSPVLRQSSLKYLACST